MPAKPSVAFLGLGIMGKSMAGHILKAGYPLTVYNRTAEKTRDLVAAGARPGATPAAAAQGAAAVISMVNDGPDVEEVLLGPQGAVRGAAPGTVFIDMSTISPDTARALAKRLEEKGMEFLDAPVSGGDVGAQKATLTIMAGGKKEVWEKMKPLLAVLGTRLTHAGPAGSGQLVKACNQVVGAVNLLAVCEALALAEKNGIDPLTMIQVLAGGASQSWSLENLGPRIARGDFAPGFRVRMMLKDLNIVAGLAQKQGLTLPGTDRVREYFQKINARGEGERGTQVLAKELKAAPAARGGNAA